MAALTPAYFAIHATSTTGYATTAVPLNITGVTRERVHADTPIGQIVRDDVAGKYYLKADGKRQGRITFTQAVAYATMPGAVVHYGVFGGSTFDRVVKERLA